VLWTTIQLGSREHYAVAVALHEAGLLEWCITDAWLSPLASSALRPFLASLAARRNDRLPNGKVKSNTAGRLLADSWLKLRRLQPWPLIMERNTWFGRWAAQELVKSEATVVFSYSYTARLPFAQAHKQGRRCILGQIDPGPREEDVVLEATLNYRHLAPPADRAPQNYWDLWRDEIALADKIIVNSPWSANLLVEAGVGPGKIVEVPLVYERAESSVSDGLGRQACLEDSADSSKSSDSNPLATRHLSPVIGSRPRLQALFLGSVILRKGVGQLFDAIRMLKNELVDFVFAGPVGLRIPDMISTMSNVRFLGPVDKATAERLYRDSDVFLFPTLSDGFGLTQLEALGQGLPVIASANCGQVVEDRVSGLVLSEITPEAIADAVMQLVRDRDLLARLKANAQVPSKCHPRHLAPALLGLERH